MNFSKKNHELQKINKNDASKSIKIAIAIALLTTLVLSSCSKDDGPAIPSAIVSNITTIINENPQNGTAIGTITTDMAGTLSYSISSQSVVDAFNINSNTGEVFVNDNSKFDFETNPTLGATVSVTNSSETATGLVSVTLNNIDDIAFFLSISQPEYNAAAFGNWIKITAEEYNILATSLNDVTKSGTTDSQYDDDSQVLAASSSTNGIFFANDNGITMPANSYCFAFKYNAVSGAVPNTTKVKTSGTSATSNYSDLGSTLPVVNTAEAHYFVFKGNDVIIQGIGYLGIYSSLNIGYKVIADSTSYHYTLNDSSDLDTVGGTSSAIILYQGLTTTQKQWD